MYIFDIDFIVKKIFFAMLVKSGTGTPIHNDRPSHGFAFSISGTKIYHFNSGINIEVNTNDIIYLPKYSSYVVENIKPGDCYAVNFDIDVDEIFEPQKWHFNNNGILTDVFDTLSKLYLSKLIGYEYKLKSLLYELLYLIKKEQCNTPANNASLLIRPALEYIEQKYTDSQITVTALANMCNISDTYFRRLFYNSYKTTPLKYINSKRLELAKHLIESEIYSIKEIQKICGFNDPCVFSRVFKAHIGCSPSDYNLR